MSKSKIAAMVAIVSLGIFVAGCGTASNENANANMTKPANMAPANKAPSNANMPANMKMGNANMKPMASPKAMASPTKKP
ncbi:MAG TPA: hypothetical protein VHD88_07935 [Pyrinomonadaceae bacterium]|nr:hypothetical protein [Pyrinomonadaceae bacterium]